jgi:hypothetical protein
MTIARMGVRRKPGLFICIAKGWLLGLTLVAAVAAHVSAETVDGSLKQETRSIQVTFDPLQPGLSALSIDSLKRGEFRASPIVAQTSPLVRFKVSVRGGWVRYALGSDPANPVWEMRCEGDTLTMRSHFRLNQASRGLTWRFNPDVTHATLLGHVTAGGDVALPAVLHLPGMGSLRIFAKGSSSAALPYDAHRTPVGFVSVTFPAATANQTLVEYSLRTAAIFPAIPGIDPGDTRFDGFRRDFLDIFQLQAEMHVLANHAASDPCALTVYEYADMARYTPELVKGLTALDLIRDTLDRYLGGFVSYAMPGYKGWDMPADFVPSGSDSYPHPSLDTYPSLLIAAYDYAEGSGDQVWLRNNYKGLSKWAEAMMVANADGSPLLEYPESGNSGSWTVKVTVRPANWFDTIGFGHQDAYSNALGYRALRSVAALADRIGESTDAARYRKRAEEIRAAYLGAFLDPTVGVLGGWRSRDGELHNYYFPFVNGIAVRYGLIEGDQARVAMQRILDKMSNVGYRNFALGLPGNLVAIRRADYVDPDPRFGGSVLEDGSDGFEKYENGGATACHTYFTMAALYHLGEKEKGDEILMPILDAFAHQGFSGRAANGMTYDWKDWHGEPHGYEGFLTDNYYALLTVLDRAKLIAKMP